MAIRTLSLFTGYGGIELGLKLVDDDFRTACYVEREAYAVANIIAKIQSGQLDEAPIWDDVCTFDGKPWKGCIDVLTAGYPCQPFSVAGERAGTSDERYLWPEVARIIREVEPAVVFLENVPGHLTLGFDAVHAELCSLGFDVACGLFSASEIGASIQRCRLFILAVAEGGRPDRSYTRPGRPCEPSGRGCSLFPPGQDDFELWEKLGIENQPVVRRDIALPANWVDRLRLCGNGVVPVVAALAWLSLWERLK